jgi:hypothetical protein
VERLKGGYKRGTTLVGWVLGGTKNLGVGKRRGDCFVTALLAMTIEGKNIGN